MTVGPGGGRNEKPSLKGKQMRHVTGCYCGEGMTTDDRCAELNNFPKLVERGLDNPPRPITEMRKIRNQLLELYGLACSFKMLKPNGPGLPDEVKAAMETGRIIEDKLKSILMEI